MINYSEYSFIIIILSLINIFVLFIASKYTKIFTDGKSETVRKIHSKNIIKVGGISFFSLMYLFSVLHETLLINLLYLSFLFLFIGIIADLYSSFSSYIRLVIMIFFIGLFIVLNEFSISNINIQIIDQILTEYKNISILFTLICLMISVNGFNFIDGNHGLMLGTSLIILINFLLNINLIESTEIIVLIESLLIASIILFLFNFITGRIIAGDAGSYFVGILIGSIAIYLKNNDLLSSFHIACILFYPTTEVIITFIRRLFILKTNPFFPDSLHLHSLIYSLLVRNIINLGPEFKNRLCSMIILSLQIMATLFLFLYGSKIGFNFTYFIFVTVYIIIYTIFLYLEFKNKINY